MIVETELYKKAVDKFGKEHQLLVTIGETSELIAEIARHQTPAREHDEQELIDEIADVCIMMGQMREIYGERLVEAVLRKLNKLERHING